MANVPVDIGHMIFRHFEMTRSEAVHVFEDEITRVVSTMTNISLDDLKLLRLTCRAFRIGLNFVIANTQCDFGRSWHRNVMVVNSRLEFPTWYRFPERFWHPYYRSPNKEIFMNMLPNHISLQVGEMVRDWYIIDHWPRLSLLGCRMNVAIGCEIEREMMYGKFVNMVKGLNEIDKLIEGRASITRRIHPHDIGFLNLPVLSVSGESVGLTKQMAVNTLPIIPQYYGKGFRVHPHILVEFQPFEEKIAQSPPPNIIILEGKYPERRRRNRTDRIKPAKYQVGPRAMGRQIHRQAHR